MTTKPANALTVTSAYDPDGKAYRLGGLLDSFVVYFDTPTDRYGLPYTLTFVFEGKTHHFGGYEIDELLQWGLDFVTGVADAQGVLQKENK